MLDGKTDKICILVLVRNSNMNLNSEEAAVPMETSVTRVKPRWPMVVLRVRKCFPQLVTHLFVHHHHPIMWTRSPIGQPWALSNQVWSTQLKEQATLTTNTLVRTLRWPFVTRWISQCHHDGLPICFMASRWMSNIHVGPWCCLSLTI
jgi:hypothetical protein